jgi:hypothetical protein
MGDMYRSLIGLLNARCECREACARSDVSLLLDNVSARVRAHLVNFRVEDLRIVWL